jgi:glycosyltransferase involved in cell wall biosynthesis
MSKAEKVGILYISHDRGLIGGAERQILELFRGLNRERFTPYLVCLEEGGPVAERAAKLDVPVRHTLRKWRWDLTVISRIRHLIRQYDVGIVHTYLGLPGFYGSVAGKSTGAKVITTIRIAGPRWRLSDIAERLAFLISDRIISNSKAGADFYFRHFPGRGKADVIYNGFDIGDFDLLPTRSRKDLELPEDAMLVGHVANLSYIKDYPTFLRAMAIVLDEQPDTVAVIVGDGDRRHEYESLARSLGIYERTYFLGHRKDVLDLVRQFDIGVLASHPRYSEGLSNSIAEYMGLGKPAVATAVGGNTELISDGVNGFLSTPGDPDDLARKIITLLRREDLRLSMGKQGRAFFEENLTLEQMVGRTEQVYERLLGSQA